MAADKGAKPRQPPRTLLEAHTALVKMRPKLAESVVAWRAYYEKSARMYAQVAEIDRGHHHEALYWADRERRRAAAMQARIDAGDTGPLGVEDW